MHMDIYEQKEKDGCPDFPSDQGCATCCSLAAGLRGNGERMRKWRENEEIERRWRENEEMDRE